MLKILRLIAALLGALVAFVASILLRPNAVDSANLIPSAQNALQSALAMPGKVSFLSTLLSATAGSSLLLMRLLQVKGRRFYMVLLVPVAAALHGVLLGTYKLLLTGDFTAPLKGLVLAPAGLLFFLIPILPGWILTWVLDSLLVRYDQKT